jgi:DNA-binding CsgD family transcriptional regulator
MESTLSSLVQKQILSLAKQGRTSREVAEQLMLSQRSVERFIESQNQSRVKLLNPRRREAEAVKPSSLAEVSLQQIESIKQLVSIGTSTLEISDDLAIDLQIVREVIMIIRGKSRFSAAVSEFGDLGHSLSQIADKFKLSQALVEELIRQRVDKAAPPQKIRSRSPGLSQQKKASGAADDKSPHVDGRQRNIDLDQFEETLLEDERPGQLSQEQIARVHALASDGKSAQLISEMLKIDLRATTTVLHLANQLHMEGQEEYMQTLLEESKSAKLNQNQIECINALASDGKSPQVISEILKIDQGLVDRALSLLNRNPEHDKKEAPVEAPEELDYLNPAQLEELIEINIGKLQSKRADPLVTQTLLLLLKLCRSNRPAPNPVAFRSEVRASSPISQQPYAEVAKTRFFSFEEDSPRLFIRHLGTLEVEVKVVRGMTFLRGSYWTEIPGHALLFTGGFRKEITDEVWSVDLLNFTMTSQPPMGKGRCSHGAVYYADCVYVVSGLLRLTNFSNPTCERFSLATSLWEQLADIPNPVACICPVVYEHAIYVVGGFNAKEIKLIQVFLFASESWNVLKVKVPSFTATIACFQIPRRHELFFVSRRNLFSYSSGPLTIKRLEKLHDPVEITGGPCHYSEGRLHWARTEGEPNFTDQVGV